MLDMTIPTRRTSLALGALLFAVTMFAGACGSDEAVGESAAPAAGEASAAAALADGAVVIDVRTPEEFDEGHVEGAQLLDIRSSEFAAGVAELDADQDYVVYCRSGNRSATARQQMQAAGLEVLDGGSLEDMVAAGWPAA
jgi:rhodanese-related sulfurtransferase